MNICRLNWYWPKLFLCSGRIHKALLQFPKHLCRSGKHQKSCGFRSFPQRQVLCHLYQCLYRCQESCHRYPLCQCLYRQLYLKCQCHRFPVYRCPLFRYPLCPCRQWYHLHRHHRCPLYRYPLQQYPKCRNRHREDRHRSPRRRQDLHYRFCSDNMRRKAHPASCLCCHCRCRRRKKQKTTLHIKVQEQQKTSSSQNSYQKKNNHLKKTRALEYKNDEK